MRVGFIILLVVFLILIYAGTGWRSSSELPTGGFAVDENQPELSQPKTTTAPPQDHADDALSSGAIYTARFKSCEQAADDDFDIDEAVRHQQTLLANASAILQQSADPEHRLAAALLSTDYGTEQRLTALQAAHAARPKDPMTTWVLLTACMQSPDAPGCTGIEQQAIAIDGENGIVWGALAANRLYRENVAGAYDALLRATTAPQFKEYAMEIVAVIERALAASSELSYSDRITVGIGSAAGVMWNVMALFDGCKTATSVQWREVCLAYGQRLEDAGNLILTISIGMHLQRTVYEASAKPEQAAAARLRRERLDDVLHAENFDEQALILGYDEQLLAAYIAEWSTHGELQALKFALRESKRLASQPGYDPCALRKTRIQ